MTILLGNRYKIIQNLGSGGFGETFLVEDTHMPARPRRVLKRLKPVTQNPQVYQIVRERFEREAAILEEVGNAHPQIPTLFAYFAEGGELYLVQEWIEGQTLTEIVQAQGSLSEDQTKEILLSLLPVLQFIHEKGLIHRDIKCDNILIQDSDARPYLIDFGAVKETLGIQLDSQGDTTGSIVIGSPGFMPPEQASGLPVFSSDLYSLGLTMIYLLTGKLPQELINPLIGEVLWRSHAPGISPELATVLDKAIQYDFHNRYATAQEMLQALQVSETEVINQIPKTEVINQIPKTEVINQIPKTEVVQDKNESLKENKSPELPKDQVPEEIRGWNWGAFLLPGLWCFPNQVWVGLLSWVPPANFVMPFILGAKGNKWAWKSRHWSNIDAFKAHQRGWTIGGLISSGLVFFIFFLIGLGAITFEDTSTAPEFLPPELPEDTSTPPEFPPPELPEDTSPQELLNRGIANHNRGSLQEAIENYTQAIRLSPNYGSAYYNRGLVYADIGNIQAAIADFEIAADLYLQQGNEQYYYDALDRITELEGFIN